jgi:hypothetical protein
MGNHVSQNVNMYSNQSQFSQRPECLKDLPLKHKQRAPLQVLSKASRASTVARALSRAVRENVAGTILTTPRVASSDCNEACARILGFDSKETMLAHSQHHRKPALSPFLPDCLVKRRKLNQQEVNVTPVAAVTKTFSF